MTIDASRTMIAEVVGLFADYREKEGNAAWGRLHNVLDDGNVSDGNVRHCIESATEIGDEDAVALGQILLTLSKTQRYNLPKAVERTIAERQTSSENAPRV